MNLTLRLCAQRHLSLDHTNGKITRSINFQQKTKIPFLSLATEEKPTCQGRGHEEE